MSSETLSRLKACIPEIVEKYPTIKKIVVFGSVIAHSMNRFSDIDIYVDTVAPSMYWNLMSDFSRYMGRDIDLLTPDDDSYITGIILKKGKMIYERKD